MKRHSMGDLTMRLAPLLLHAVVASACLQVNVATEPAVPLGAPFDLKAGATALVRGGLTIRFDAVTADSRCPIDVVCVQMGEAVVVMTVDEPRERSAQPEWRTSPLPFEVAYSKYAISLIELRPYPKAGIPIPQKDYVATIRVTER